MAQSFISKLPEGKQQELLDDLNYLNIAEIKSLCKRYSIPYRIAIETKDGGRRITKDDDRKGVVLNRIRHFLQTGAILEETRFPASVVCFDQLAKNITADDSLFYGQYDKTSRTMITLLKKLTDGQFKNGAIARITARDFWASGRAPTFREYASAWLRATKEHIRPNPEWAFLSDRANQVDVRDWKKVRKHKAAKVMKVLTQLSIE